ncbi:MAG: HD domain-containing protein [Chloroflexota bacterium]
MKNKIAEIESFVQETMAKVTNPERRIGHDFKHVDRVRNWALILAKHEQRPELELIEAAALLHDIGLAYVTERQHHAEIGADIATDFLEKQDHFSKNKIKQIYNAIRLHSSPKPGDWLADLLRDADRMELFGAVGIIRAFSSKHWKEEYDPLNIKGETWRFSIQQFEGRFADGTGIGPTIVDQLNFQLSLYDDLYTESAKRLARPFYTFTQQFILQLEQEINAPIPN